MMESALDSLPPISQRIWDMKYRLRTPDGEPVDKTIAHTWRRVAKALAAGETDSASWEERFYAILADGEFLPAGRIIAGAGTDRSVTLFNCFVMGTIPDDMGGIFGHLREAALTMQQGGGIGYDFSTLRPKGAPVKGVGADASGPVSFMDVWDAMCRTIMSAGSRRGAMMATMRCDHPDIEAFIDAKREPDRLRMFNLSVLITEGFMSAVRDDADWPLVFGGEVYRTLRARDLWDRIMQATYAYAEPGVIFIDRTNRMNNLWYCEKISATNPCGEQPLPPYGACLLGSINLARLVREPFTGNARLDLDRLREIVPVAVRLMDNVIDISRFPLPQQKEEARNKRRIGLGVTGLADALILCGVRYGSEQAVALTEEWLKAIQHTAYLASADLAAEKGSFPQYVPSKYTASPVIQTLDSDVRVAIGRHGIRNALITSIAPTGTISLFAGNVSSGIEPVFAYTYQRAVLQNDGSRLTEEVQDYAYRLFRQTFGPDAELPDYFVDAQSLTPTAHLVMQSAAQRHVDSSISKTINVPEDFAFEDFKGIYMRAWEMHLKGCTTYRPNPITGSVLTVVRKEEPPVVAEAAEAAAGEQAPRQIGYDRPAAEEAPRAAASERAEAPRGEDGVVYMTRPLDRPEALPGETYKVRWPDSDHALYITINDIIQDGRRRPFEVFINSKNMEHYAWTVALTRMISAVFRRGGDVAFVVEELKAVFDPRGGQWMNGRYVPSLLAAIGEVIERHMMDIGFLPPRVRLGHQAARKAAGDTASPPVGRICPSCGQPAVIRKEGCDTCQNCDYSRCN
ncbi:MAG TPA: adenosylcobalamin-dependent ribonucleoside-diphosphate reductase [Azospirillaceae bacterium]|nr:adenosylcobalamin-dependent ribonucleoside-diphosphate reductase [Azospirillaceae bacterium]